MRALIMALMFFTSAVYAADAVTEREHPRVAELQDRLTDNVRGYLQTRLQGVPFMVTVKIEAMRRKQGSKYTPQAEKLPYYDLNEEEIRDEWDDPSASIYALQGRIQKATVMISVPKGLTDEEVTEIQDSLTSLLRLIPGRDEIKVERRPWTIADGFPAYAAAAFALCCFLLIGLLFISRAWAQRLSTAIHEIKPKERSEEASAQIAVSNQPTQMPGEAPRGQGLSTDVKFRDSLRTREFVGGRIADLMKHEGFPNLAAMTEMEKLAETAPADLGALLMEFPVDMQKKIFACSFSPGWLAAFTEPGELSNESIGLADRLCRIQYTTISRDWDELIIQCWRLGAGMSGFLKSLAKDEALAVLKAMPPSTAIPAARAAFPGAWAVLLDPAFKPQTIPPARTRDILKTAMGYKAPSNFAALDLYRQEKDLLQYLLVASVAEEMDIYGALPENSFLWDVRPPFFRVGELSGPELEIGFAKVSLDDWALALFNVPRDQRKAVESLFNPKQKFMFAGKMRAIDQNGVDKATLGRARERVARVYHHLLPRKASFGEPGQNAA